jgi:hypothetical protein
MRHVFQTIKRLLIGLATPPGALSLSRVPGRLIYFGFLQPPVSNSPPNCISQLQWSRSRDYYRSPQEALFHVVQPWLGSGGC